MVTDDKRFQELFSEIDLAIAEETYELEEAGITELWDFELN